MAKHVKLNGIWYRLAEDAEGEHYRLSLQPLRLPNSQVVQGSTGDFQIRPDLLLWSWSDWSQGENQIVYDPEFPGRSYILQNVDPFSKPGTLGLGYFAQLTTGLPASSFTLVIAQGTLWAVPESSSTLYEWDGSAFVSAGTMTGVSGSSANSATGDADYLFVLEAATNNIHRRDSAGTWTLHNDQCTGATNAILSEYKDYVYVWNVDNGEVFEISKATANTATPETPIYYLPNTTEANYSNLHLTAVGDNRIYFCTFDGIKSSIHELVPSSAAGTGYGTEIATISGVKAEAMFFYGGTIYMIATSGEPSTQLGPDRQIFYIDPQGAYGTLGSVRGFTETNGIPQNPPQPAGGRLARLAFTTAAQWEELTADAARMSLFEVDQVSGGMACVGVAGSLLSFRADPDSLVFWDDSYFMAFPNDVVRWITTSTSFGVEGMAISPSHDFNLAEQKILDSIEVTFDPLPSGGEVRVGYQLDGGAWTDVLVSDTQGVSGGRVQISTDSATATFRNLKVRLKLTSTAIPSATNVRVRSVNVYARVNRRIRVWDLMLDAQDDAAPLGYNGAQIIDNILNIGENTVIDFVDAYRTHDHENAGTTYDVVVDSAVLSATQEGEGIMMVRLLEVI